MKPSPLLILASTLLANGILTAQAPPMIEPVPVPGAPEGTPRIQSGSPQSAPPPEVLAPIPAPSPPETIPSPAPQGPAIVPVNPSAPADPGMPVPLDTPPGGAFAPLEAQKREIQEQSDGYIIKDANLNDIFQFLAKSAGKQYFHNMKINGQEYLVTGHLNDGKPLQQMEELAFMYGLSLHTKGNTIYALTSSQLAGLPPAEFHYHLKYLRPSDFEQIQKMIKDLLSPGTGIVNFEPKTNTIIVIDTPNRIQQVQDFLHSIDQAKGQIVVETKILRINSKAAERQGINWSSSLGATGTTIEVAQSLNSIFGVDTFFGDGQVKSSTGVEETFRGEPHTVLSPIQLRGVLRALSEGNLANQVAHPTVITEDNEMASISIIDRIPIITTTINQSADSTSITEEVRYKIDTADKTISEDPEKHREIGISIVVTPTILDDGTIRMRMRPRSAQIVENIRGQSGNVYPRVTESMVESLARVPDGHSLVVGGFYGESQSRDRNKIPLLGDLPVLNFFFKSKETTKEQSSLIFIVTPKSYNPTNHAQNSSIGAKVQRDTELTRDYDWVDPYNPGPAHEPNLPRSIRGVRPEQAPYYPRAEELAPAPIAPKKKISAQRMR